MRWERKSPNRKNITRTTATWMSLRTRYFRFLLSMGFEPPLLLAVFFGTCTAVLAERRMKKRCRHFRQR